VTIQKLFPTALYVKKHPRPRALLHALEHEARVFRKIDELGEQWSKKNYIGGYTSYSSITDLPYRSTRFGKLKSWIDSQVGIFARALELELEGGELRMDSCWLNIMGKGAQHASHLHPLSVVSGTFYLRVPPGSGDFKIEDPRLAAFMASPARKVDARIENRRFVSIEPSAGMLLLFESWMKHEVTPNRSNHERMSVSFNYSWERV
jgi:uncharacterized protein (TIGR02466 family)